MRLKDLAGTAVILFALAGAARGDLVPGIIGYEEAVMHDCLGPNDGALDETYEYEYVAGGERLRIYITVDDDDDEVQTCDLVVTAQRGATTISLYDSTVDSVYDYAQSCWVAAGTGVWGQGDHRFVVKVPENLGGGTAGTWTVKITATVVTPVDQAGTEETEPEDVTFYRKKKWNCLFYVAGDNNLAPYALSDLEEMDDEGTTEDVNIIVLSDIPGTEYGSHKQGLLRIHYNWDPDEQGYWMRDAYGALQQNGQYAVQQWADYPTERVSSDASYVEKFFLWANEVHPAEKTAIVLWDHGGGWWGGFCEDEPNNHSMMTHQTLEPVLSHIKTAKGGPLEVLGFDACLMANAEVVYQFREDVQHYVGSEEVEGGAGWEWEEVCDVITDSPTMTAEELAEAIVEEADESDAIKTLSATRVGEGAKTILDLRAAVEALAAQLRSDAHLFPCHLIRCREEARYVMRDYGQFTEVSYIDLYDYCGRIVTSLSGVAGGGDVRQKAQDVINLLVPAGNGTVISKNYTVPNYSGYGGLTIGYSMLTFRMTDSRAGTVAAKKYLTYYPCPDDAKNDADNKHTGNTHIADYLDAYYLDAATRVDWASSGGGKSNWMQWIEHDIVPPRIVEMKITELDGPGGSSEVRYHYNRTDYRPEYDEKDGANYNGDREDDLTGKANGEQEIEITFDEEMDQTVNPTIGGFAQEVTSLGWVSSTKWKGRVTVDSQDFDSSSDPKGRLEITVSGAKDVAGNEMDNHLQNLQEAEGDDTHRLDILPAPHITSVEIWQDSDENPSTGAAPHAGYERQIYSYTYTAPPDGSRSYPGAGYLAAAQKAVAGSGKGGRAIWVRIVFCHWMDPAWADFEFQLDPQGDGVGEGPIDAANITWSTTTKSNDTVTGVIMIPEPTPRYKSQNLDSKGLPGADSHTMDAEIVVVAKDYGENTLDVDSDWKSDEDLLGDPVADRLHKIKIDTKHDVKPDQKPHLKVNAVN